MVAFAAPGNGEVAFVAGRKVGKAVQRNRARRVLRAGWNEVSLSARVGTDFVFVARKAILGVKSQQVAAEMADLLRRSGEASA